MSTQRTPSKSATKKQSPKHHSSDPVLHVSQLNEETDFNITRRTKRRLDDQTYTDTNTMSELRLIIEEIKTQQSEKFNALKSATDTILDQNKEIKASMQHLSDNYDDILTTIKKLQQENKQQKTYIYTLEAKIEQLERISLSTSFELRNIPKKESENKQNLVDITKEICSIISAPIQESDICDVFRLKLKEKPDSPIIVSLTSSLKKDNIITAVRTYNKNKSPEYRLNTSCLKMEGQVKPIYVAESLTKKVKHLHYLARTFTKNFNYESCWISYGRVFLRRSKDEPRILIDSEEVLEKLKKSM